jgi:hypothetical protein
MFTCPRLLAAAFTTSALLIGSTVHAQDEIQPLYNTPPPDVPLSSVIGAHGYTANRGLQLGARFGYGGGTGIVYSGLSVTDASNGGLPIIVDLGVRALPQLYVGLYGQFAPIFTKNNPVSCPDGFDCTTQQWRFGVEADYHFVPRSKLDPYIGLGSGYEILHTSVNGTVPVPTPLGTATGNVHAGIIDRGWEFANLTLGFDARLNHVVGVGPFVSASISEYGVHDGTQVVAVGGTTVSNTPIPEVTHGVHELYFAGVRGTFNP